MTPFMRGYVLGHRAAYRKARKDLHSLAADFDSQIAALRTEFAGVVADIHRFRAIERGLDAERDFDARLH